MSAMQRFGPKGNAQAAVHPWSTPVVVASCALAVNVPVFNLRSSPYFRWTGACLQDNPGLSPKRSAEMMLIVFGG